MTNRWTLVTGGAGFIGEHLCRNLLKSGRNVVCVDDLSSGSQRVIQSLMKEFGKDRFIFKCHDIRHQFDNSLSYLKIDEIYHLACNASPKVYQTTPIKTLETCFIGTQNTLKIAVTNDAKVLAASTSEVYGDPIISPQPEDYNGNVSTTSIRACYDEGKRVMESLCAEYRRRYELRITVVRIFNTYGPGLRHDDGRVVSNFIVQALKNEPLTVYGTGEQTRSFCYVSDTVGALIGLMDHEGDCRHHRYNNNNWIFNVGNPNEVTINETAEIVLNLTGSTSVLMYHDLPEADPKKRKPDISRITTTIGWKPVVTLEEGLLKTIEYFNNK